MKKLIFLLIPLLLLGCNPCKRLWQKCPPLEKHDSIYVEKVKLDTVPVYLPSDTTIIEIPVEVPVIDLLVSEENKAQKIELQILKGRLKLKTICKEDSLKVIISNLEKRLKEQTVITKEVEKPVYIKKVPKFYKICTLILFIVILLITLYIYLRIKGKALTKGMFS